MPRKQASRTVLVKKVRNRTWAGNHRIQHSSRNNSRTLTRKRSLRTPSQRLGGRGVCWLVDGSVSIRSSSLRWFGNLAKGWIPIGAGKKVKVYFRAGPAAGPPEDH